MMFLSRGRAVIRASHIAARVANGLCVNRRSLMQRLMREMCAVEGQREVERDISCAGGESAPINSKRGERLKFF